MTNQNKFKPYRGTEAEIMKQVPPVPGQLLFTTDTKKIFIDTSNDAHGRQLVSKTNLNEFTNGPGFISASQVPTAEQDPIFVKSPAHNIREYDISNWNSKAPGSHTHDNADITSIDASKIKTGTLSAARLPIIPLEKIPHAALERCVVVANDTARKQLTKEQIQTGDTVKVTDTGKMYFVIDDTKLSSDAGYEIYTAGSAASVDWTGITNKPSAFEPTPHTHTKSQITDFAHRHNKSEIDGLPSWSMQPNKPKYAYNEVGAAPASHSHTVSQIENFPTTMTPTAHTHKKADITDFAHTHTKSEVGLGNVDNTADSAKNVHSASVIRDAGDNRDLTIQYSGTEVKPAYLAGWVHNKLVCSTIAQAKEAMSLDNVSNVADSQKSVKYAASAGNIAWDNVSGKPTTFAPSSHNHDDRYYTESEINSKLSGKANTAHRHDVSDIDGNWPSSRLTGEIPSNLLPSYVDDVIEYIKLASFPTKGEMGKIYVDTTTNKTYRWSGSSYVEISASLALGTTSSTAFRGDLGNTAYQHSQQTGNPHGVGWENLTSKPSSLPASDVSAWAKASSKPSYNLDEINNGSNYVRVTPGEKAAWNNKVSSFAATASVNNTTGTPSVKVTKSGNAATPTYDFAFSNLKGEMGPPGKNGTNGTNGTSVTHSWKGAQLTLTSASGTTTTNLQGPPGPPGKDAGSDTVLIQSAAPTSSTCKIWIKI